MAKVKDTEGYIKELYLQSIYNKQVNSQEYEFERLHFSCIVYAFGFNTISSINFNNKEVIYDKVTKEKLTEIKTKIDPLINSLIKESRKWRFRLSCSYTSFEHELSKRYINENYYKF